MSLTHLNREIGSDPLEHISSSKRRELKKLLELKNNGKIELTQSPDTEEVWQIVKEHAARKDFIREKGTFNQIFNPEHDFIHSIGLSYQPYGLVSVAICAVDNKAIYYLIGASKTEVPKELKTLSLLLIYELLEECGRRELVFDFEGSMLKGVEFFFREMGGEQTGIYEVQKSPSLMFSAIRALKQLRQDRK